MSDRPQGPGAARPGPGPPHRAFIRYLAAKKAVDDHALNRTVWQALRRALAEGPARPRLLEVGAGIGTMVERAVEWELLRQAEYTALDTDATLLAEARRRLTAWAEGRGWRAEAFDPQTLRLQGPEHNLVVRFIAQDLTDFLAAPPETHAWDLLLAHAFLDLVDLPTTLPPLLSLARPGGLAYFSLNFDGLTVFEPPIDPDLDRQVLDLYHRTMDERRVRGRPSGNSRTGRRLFTHLRALDAEVLEAGASDWMVFPRRHGYRPEERAFLEAILETVLTTLQRHPELEPEALERWIGARRAQLDAAELVYIAHQVDLLARLP